MDFQEIPLNQILLLGTALFFVGLYGFLTRKNMITMLIAIEIMLNGVNINLLGFNKYLHPQALEGMFFIVFIITVAAAEAAIAIAIIINIYKNFKSVDSEVADILKY